jgi:hypothetical protein
MPHYILLTFYWRRNGYVATSQMFYTASCLLSRLASSHTSQWDATFSRQRILSSWFAGMWHKCHGCLRAHAEERKLAQAITLRISIQNIFYRSSRLRQNLAESVWSKTSTASIQTRSQSSVFQVQALTHGAESFLRSRQLCSYSRTFQHFMEPEGSLPCSQEPSTGPYLEPDRSSPYHPILALKNPF